MTRKEQRRGGKGAIELIEEAVHLLRLAPGGVLAAYYLGTLPFALGFLYFWADMAHSAFGHQRCVPAALGVALLFVWMKTWQAVFARQLRAQMTSESLPQVSLRRLLRVAVAQAALQPSGFLILPLALIAALPFGWAYAFYQNVTVCGGEAEADVRTVYQKAVGQSRLWPKQNHLVLSILGLFGLVVFFNVVVGMIQVPFLLKTFLGIETQFTRSIWSVLNTTFFATCCVVTYLCLDPLIKAAYALRCFYGESLQTGEDLKVELRRAPSLAIMAAMLGLLLGGTIASPAADSPAATELPKPSLPMRVSTPELDRAIEEVINRREYSWRLPRERVAQDETKKGFFAAFMDGVIETIRRGMKIVFRWLKTVWEAVADFIDWLWEKLGRGKTAERAERGVNWMVSLQVLVFVLLALVACTVGILFWRMWHRRRHRREEVIAEPSTAAPDLNDENVVANQLPEEGWLKLAAELMEQGDLRLALRALYLASLAHLAQREFISIAKFKSNRDYEIELRRRTRALPELQGAFAENVGVFDRVWYGMHEVSRDVLQHFQANLERIKAC